MADTQNITAGDLDTQVYEVGFHISTAAGEEGAPTVFERVKNLVVSAGGSIIAEGQPQKMALATEIFRATQGKRERHTESYFAWIKFEATAASSAPIETALKKDADILRFLLIKTVRESGSAPRFLSSDRLEGETIRKREVTDTDKGPVSEEELDKSIEQLVGERA